MRPVVKIISFLYKMKGSKTEWGTSKREEERSGLRE
jgi:hypothetical protein